MKGTMVRPVVLAMAAALLAGGLAVAQGPGAGMGMGPVVIARHEPPFGRAFGFRGAGGRWWNNPRVAAELKLTGAQREAMDKILYQHREQLIDLQANLERANLGMEPLMNADAPNQNAIDAQIDKVVQARADLERADARFLLALRLQLTPEQWKQVRDLRARRAMMMRRGPQPWQWRQQDGQFKPQGAPPPPPPSSVSSGTGSQAPSTGASQ